MSSTANELKRLALDSGWLVKSEHKHRTVYAKGTKTFSIPRGHGNSFDTAVANNILRAIKKGDS